jgi:hypothetical protein
VDVKVTIMFTPPAISLEVSVAEAKEMGGDFRKRIRDMYEEFKDELRHNPAKAIKAATKFEKEVFK